MICHAADPYWPGPMPALRLSTSSPCWDQADRGVMSAGNLPPFPSTVCQRAAQKQSKSVNIFVTAWGSVRLCVSDQSWKRAQLYFESHRIIKSISQNMSMCVGRSYCFSVLVSAQKSEVINVTKGERQAQLTVDQVKSIVFTSESGTCFSQGALLLPKATGADKKTLTDINCCKWYTMLSTCWHLTFVWSIMPLNEHTIHTS